MSPPVFVDKQAVAASAVVELTSTTKRRKKRSINGSTWSHLRAGAACRPLAASSRRRYRDTRVQLTTGRLHLEQHIHIEGIELGPFQPYVGTILICSSSNQAQPRSSRSSLPIPDMLDSLTTHVGTVDGDAAPVSAVCCRRSAVFRRFARSCLRTMVVGPGCRPRSAVHGWRYTPVKWSLCSCRSV
jgi:hypothetical protein